MWRLTKALLFLAVLAALGFIAYAYVGPIVTPADFEPAQEDVVEPVTLDLE